MSRLRRAVWVAIGLALTVLPSLPLPRWAGAPDQGPAWSPQLLSWSIGIVVVLSVGLLVGRVAGWFAPVRMRLRLPPDAVTVGVCTAALTVGAGAVMLLVFSGNPHLVDEMAQLFHARVFASGRLAAPPPALPEHFLLTNTWITDAGWVSQYPPGQSLLLSLGVLLRAEWLVNPVLGGVSAVLLYAVTRGWYGRRTALVTALLWTVSAWVLSMAATYMNHMLAVTLVLGAWACMWAPGRVARLRLCGVGTLLALAVATRPLDAIAGAVPVLYALTRSRDWRGTATVAVGAAPALALLACYNWLAFGSPITSGYAVLWGERHALGFHVDPWGSRYTPLVGLSNMAVGIRRLHIYLFEWPIPAVLPLAAWALGSRHADQRDGILALALISGPLLYFLYWHSAFYPGPRFYFIAAPALVIGTARAIVWATEGLAGTKWGIQWRPAVVGATILVVLWGTITLLPARMQAYRSTFPSLKLHPERDLPDSSARRVLVLIPESWTARMTSHLWSLGVSPGWTERAVTSLDACDLQEFIAAAREAGRRDAEVEDSLASMLQTLAVPVSRVARWPDPALRLRPRTNMPETCARELRHDVSGFTLFGSVGWRNRPDLRGNLVFARDHFERNPALLAQYPEWEVWRYAPPAGQPEAMPVLQQVGIAPANPQE